MTLETVQPPLRRFFFNFSGPASVQCVIVILCIDFGIVLELQSKKCVLVASKFQK